MLGYQQLLRTFGAVTAGGGDTPGVPAILAVDAGDGSHVTVTVDGDAGVTNYVYYKLATAETWTAGGNRSGDGDVSIGGLTNEAVYDFIAVSREGDYYSLPSNMETVRVTGGTGVTPAGLYSLPLHYLRLTLAGSATFQTLVGAANAAEALAYIFPVASAVEPTPPFAVVDWWSSFSRSKIATGARTHFAQGPSDLQMLIRASIDRAHGMTEAAYTFTNTMGAIIADMEQLAGMAGYLDISGFDLMSGPERPDEDEVKTIGDFYQALYRVSWEGM